MGPASAEQDALALVDAVPDYQGKDGFAALYTVAHDIPEAKQGSVLAEDLQRVMALPPLLCSTIFKSKPWVLLSVRWNCFAAARASAGPVLRAETPPDRASGVFLLGLRHGVRLHDHSVWPQGPVSVALG